ncbi:MAG: hypothetical protein ACOXZV_06020 [Bacteroidales bacterium]|jgi:hypothetical protein
MTTKEENWKSYLKHSLEEDVMTEKEKRFVYGLDLTHLSQKQYYWLRSLAKKYGYGQKENLNYWKNKNLD